MLRRASAARRDQRHSTLRTHGAELRDVVSLAHAIAGHAVEHDLARAAFLHLAHPIQRLAGRVACPLRIAGELIHVIVAIDRLAVDADDHALRAEAGAEPADQLRIGEGRGVDRHFLRAFAKHFLGVGDAANAAGDAKRNIQDARDAANPAAIDRASIGTRGDVVEHQLVGAFVAIARRKLEDVAHDHVIAEAHALDDLPVSYIEAGDDAFGKNGRNSSR